MAGRIPSDPARTDPPAPHPPPSLGTQTTRSFHPSIVSGRLVPCPKENKKTETNRATPGEETEYPRIPEPLSSDHHRFRMGDHPPPRRNRGSRVPGWWKAFWQPLVATANTPPYTMMISLGLYGATMCLGSPAVRAVGAAYGAYCVLDPSPRRLSKSPWVRGFLQPWLGNSWIVRWTAEYFPSELVRTTPLPPGRPYIFSYHPHGVIGMGCSTALATNGCGFEEAFPGIDRSLVTLNVCFWVPLFRHWMSWLGLCSADKRTMRARLAKGDSLVLVPGGAAEALHARPGSFKLVLRNRKGFVRLAVETGAALVPVLGFGENDVFDTVYLGDTSSSSGGDERTPGNPIKSWIWGLQQKLYQYLTFAVPLWFHLFPRRVPIAVVVGAPVVFSRTDREAGIEACHAVYLRALEDLYDQHKAAHGHGGIPLEFV